MSELSVSNNILRLKLEKEHENHLVTNFLEKRIHFRRIQGDNLVTQWNLFETRNYNSNIKLI